MDEFDVLRRRYKHPEERWCNDGAIITQMLGVYIAGSPEIQTRIRVWMLVHVQKKSTKRSAWKCMLDFLYRHEKEMSKQLRKEFKEYVARSTKAQQRIKKLTHQS